MILTEKIPSIYNQNLESLKEKMVELNQPLFRASQIWSGIYHHFYSNWNQFSTLPAVFQSELAHSYTLQTILPEISFSTNNKNSQKILFLLYDKQPIESVLMRSESRHTLCLSTQAGCGMGCIFCATGKLGLLRNLTTGEIIEQVIFFERLLVNQNLHINNIVFMGMGEPFSNYEAVLNAVQILNHPAGLNFGSRHFTISTIGIVPQIYRFAKDAPQVNLAISLHAPNDELRTQLVPMNKYYPLSQLITACKDYVKLTNRRITFEYVLINKINDSQVLALQLVALLRNLMCHVNLIAYNPIEDQSLSTPSLEDIQDFYKILIAHGIPTTIRRSLGTEIKAGCGQLAGKI